MRTPIETAPAFLFYVKDWIVSTAGMPRELKGAYVDLLCYSWVNGPIPNDPEWRLEFLGPAAPRLWALLAPRWILTARGWINRRLETVRAEMISHREKQRARGERGAAARWAKHDANATPKQSVSNAQAMPPDAFAFAGTEDLASTEGSRLFEKERKQKKG